MSEFIKATDTVNVNEVPDDDWSPLDGPEEAVNHEYPGFMDCIRATVRTWMAMFGGRHESLSGIIAESIVSVLCEFPVGRRVARDGPKSAELAEEFEASLRRPTSLECVSEEESSDPVSHSVASSLRRRRSPDRYPKPKRTWEGAHGLWDGLSFNAQFLRVLAVLIDDLADPTNALRAQGTAAEARKMARVLQAVITELENTARRYERDHPGG